MAELEALLAPIAGDNPSGVELRYEPVYDEIKEARRDETHLPEDYFQHGETAKKADWAKVVKLAEGALTKQGKDLQIAGWLAEAWLHRDGFGGLAEGLRLIRGLVDDLWDSVYPELDGSDADFRAAPLNWLGSQLDLPIRQVPINQSGHTYLEYKSSLDAPTQEEADGDADKAARRADALLTPEDAESGFQATDKAYFRSVVGGLEEALAELEALEKTCDERFADFERNDQVPPVFSETRTMLQAVHQASSRLLARKLEVDPDPVDLTAPVTPGGHTAAAPAEPTSGPPTSREDACNRVAVAARYLRDENPTDPGPYLMVRGLRWGELRAGGSDLDPRLLAAPPTATRTHLKGLLLDGEWVKLLEAGEEIMATPYGRGWLDLQRYILTAIDSLGGEYEPVGLAIRGALKTLLRDLPDLAESTLMDDTPTANRESRAWLKDEGIFGGFSDSAEEEFEGAERSAPQSETEGVARVLRRARSEAGAGRHERAIKLLQQRTAAEATQRGRFLLRTEAAAIMLESGHDAVALPMLHELYHETSSSPALSQWEEAAVVARPMSLLYQCALRTGDTSVDTDSLYLEVCRLDPMAAMELPKPGEAPPAEEYGSEEQYDNG